jgi:hypothetical protein
LAAARGHEEAAAAAVVDALARHRDLVLRALTDLDQAPAEAVRPLLPRILPSLRRVATHPDAAVRARVARLMARLGDVELTAAALADAAPSVRLAALGALAAAPTLPPPSRPQLAPLVERTLRAPDWRERRAGAQAASAHAELWPDKGARALAPLRHDPSGFVREALR